MHTADTQSRLQHKDVTLNTEKSSQSTNQKLHAFGVGTLESKSGLLLKRYAEFVVIGY